MIKSSPELVSKIYSHKVKFDTKLIDDSINKTLAAFCAKNAKIGLLKLASQIDDRDLIQAIIFSIPELKLKTMLINEDKFWPSDHVTSKDIRDHLFKIATGAVRPIPDRGERAKALLTQLKKCKKIEELKNLFDDGDSKDTIEASAGLLKPEKTLRAFIRRFDKNNTTIETDSPQDLIKHLVALASGQVTPAQKAVKPLKSAAMKAKWSGKEPD